MSFFQLLTRLDDIHGRADNHCVRYQAIVILFGHVTAKHDAAQAGADRKNLIILETVLYVLDCHVQILKVGCTICSWCV